MASSSSSARASIESASEAVPFIFAAPEAFISLSEDSSIYSAGTEVSRPPTPFSTFKFETRYKIPQATEIPPAKANVLLKTIFLKRELHIFLYNFSNFIIKVKFL